MEVRVTGTKFNVKAYSKSEPNIWITLDEGEEFFSEIVIMKEYRLVRRANINCQSREMPDLPSDNMEQISALACQQP